jgi:hypothetical protein
MRCLLGVAALLLAAVAVRGGEESAEALVKELLRAGEETHKALQGIKDRKSAEALKPKLADLSTRFLRAAQKLEALAKKSPKAFTAMMKKHKEQGDRMGAGINREIDRIAKDREAYAAIKDTGVVSITQSNRVAAARVSVATISRAVDTYKVATGDYPKSLAVLTKGKKLYLEPAALTDPWGRPYRYEPDTLEPTTGRPLVYSEGPQPGVPGSAIRNWTAEGKQ